MTKFVGLFENPNPLETARETKYETVVCTTKITGMTASSVNLSEVNCLANFVKTILSQFETICLFGVVQHTQTRREQSHVQIRHELLFVGIEHALPRNNISWQTDTYHFHHSLEY